ncbi:putative cyclin-dependent kinase CMGC-CDK-PITSLRE family [Dioscorea sansibarensis]
MLGQGAYGCVFEAIDLRTGDIVAIKQAKFGANIQEIPSTSVREIDILSSCRHPNIISFRESIIDVALHSVFCRHGPGRHRPQRLIWPQRIRA